MLDQNLAELGAGVRKTVDSSTRAERSMVTLSRMFEEAQISSNQINERVELMSHAVQKLHNALESGQQSHGTALQQISSSFYRVVETLGLQQAYLAIIARSLERFAELKNESSPGTRNQGKEIGYEQDGGLITRELVQNRTPGQQGCNDVSDNLSEVDLFFDCVSRLSLEETSYLLDTLSPTSDDTPSSYFERSSNFFPEKYATGGIFSSMYTVVGVRMQSPTAISSEESKGIPIAKYFLLYAKSPRCWLRITVTVANTGRPGNDLRLLLDETLPNANYCDTITNITLSTSVNKSNNSFNATIREDIEEIGNYDSGDHVHMIDDMGCPQFLESEILTECAYAGAETGRSMESNCSVVHRVQVEGRPCLAKRIPFASSLKSFIHELKALYRLRESAGVVKFLGVILDDSRQQLKDFLEEVDMYGTVQDLFEFDKPQLPLTILESWAKQVTSAVSEFHSKEVIIGRLTLGNLSIFENGHVKICNLELRDMPDAWGRLAPELRTRIRPSRSALEADSMTSKGDIFQLGLIIWLLMEQISGEVVSLENEFCRRSDCGLRVSLASENLESSDSIQQIRCQARHANPIELPPCSQAVPTYIEDIIRVCRIATPKQRPSARKILDLFPLETDSLSPIDIITFLRPRGLTVAIPHFFCDNCGADPLAVHYHCDQCNQGDYDLCQECIDRGVHCRSPSHWLHRRILKNDSVIWDLGGNIGPSFKR